MQNKVANSIGLFFLLLALVTLFDNPVIGQNGYFYADFSQNLIHLITGVSIIVVAEKFYYLYPKLLRFWGAFYLSFAVLGSVLVGYSRYGHMLEVITVNGQDHILHMILGLILITLGTSSVRMPLSAEDNSDYHLDIHS